MGQWQSRSRQLRWDDAAPPSPSCSDRARSWLGSLSWPFRPTQVDGRTTPLPPHRVLLGVALGASLAGVAPTGRYQRIRPDRRSLPWFFLEPVTRQSPSCCHLHYGRRVGPIGSGVRLRPLPWIPRGTAVCRSKQGVVYGSHGAPRSSRIVHARRRRTVEWTEPVLGLDLSSPSLPGQDGLPPEASRRSSPACIEGVTAGDYCGAEPSHLLHPMTNIHKPQRPRDCELIGGYLCG